MDPICELLDSYSGRDKVVRLACYALKLAGSYYKHDGLLSASSKLSATRATMRLFDDIPMLKCTLEYGLGKEEPDVYMSILGVLGNAVDQLFYPLEKICWLGECKILKLTEKQADFYDTTNTIFWVSSLYITLLRCVKQLKITQQQKNCAVTAQNVEKLKLRYIFELITCIKLCLDVIHAVNCLPKGWLWGGKFDGVKVGAIATTSSLIGLGMYFAKKKYLK